MTLTAASVSTASRRRMKMPCRLISSTPSARVEVATMGRPSGTAATATESDERANCMSAAQPAGTEDDTARCERDPNQLLAECIELALQRSLRRDRRMDQPVNTANLR